MKAALFMLVLCFFCLGSAIAQKVDCFTIVSYNTENLFDTIKAKGKNDTDFTPGGKKKWNSYKYFNKLSNLAKVISGIDSCGCPEIVGLVEVENRKVVEDLIVTDSLKKCKYSIVHFEGNDPRGIENALLSRSEFMKIEDQKFFPVRFGDIQSQAMRDILYVKGIAGKDTLHFFVNHWKSRIGGTEKTQAKRMNDAICLKMKTDSLLSKNKKAKIIIMGDFNDNPADSSLLNVLNAYPHPPPIAVYLVNPFYSISEAGKGSYKFLDQWDLFDQIIISSGLQEASEGLIYKEGSASIFNPEWLYYHDKKTGTKKPDNKFSDHFPVYVVIERK